MNNLKAYFDTRSFINHEYSLAAEFSFSSVPSLDIKKSLSLPQINL
jgi:hypothetical protein